MSQKGIDLLTFVRHESLIISSTQKLAIENNVRETSYSFHKFKLLKLVSIDFINQKIGLETVEELEKFWRQKAYESLTSAITRTIRRNSFIYQQIRANANTTTSTTPITDTQPKNITRNRRILVSIGGELLHSILGVSTDRQVSDAQKQAHEEYLRVLYSTRMIEVRADKAQHRVTDALKHLVYFDLLLLKPGLL